MATRIISSILMLISVYVGISHGSRVFSRPTPVYIEMMEALGITNAMRIAIGVWSIMAAVLILFPKTFFAGNMLRAVQIVLMMALALKAGNYKFALIEIPFLIMPLVLIYIGHPLKTQTI
jgi:hypothetical protein